MTGVFIASLIVGLGLGVRVMMFGVERAAAAQGEARARVSLASPTLAAFAVVFGVLGYVLARRAGMTTAAATIIAAVAGVVVALFAVALVRRTAKIVPEFDLTDPRYALQGHLARVVRPITAVHDGEIAFGSGADEQVVRARSVGDETLERGADVVIERIEDDVAYVEAWHEVEKRL